VTRLTDILFLVDNWIVGTADGYTVKASPNGLSTWQTQRWIVLIDGQRADLDVFDAVNLNLLPVGVDQVDSVVVVDTPRLHGGLFSDTGMIHIFTWRPRETGSVRATLSAGNETGDPGPYRFTGYRTPNVDSMGPDGSFAFALGRGPWRLHANATYQIHYFTDFAIQRRTFDIIGETPPAPAEAVAPPVAGPGRTAAGLPGVGSDDSRPGMHRYTASAGLGFDGTSSRHKVFWGYSQAEKYYLYSEAAGREIPMDDRYHHAGLNGNFDVRSSTTVNYRLQYTSHALLRHENTLDLDYNWEQRRLLADAEVRRRFDGGTCIAAGGGFEEKSIETADGLEGNPARFGKLFGSVELDGGGRFAHRGDLMVLSGGDDPSVKAGWTTTAALRQDHRLTVQLSFAERSEEENCGLWYWVRRGYTWPDSSRISYSLPEGCGGSRTGTADLTWAFFPREELSVYVTAMYRGFSDVCIENRAYDYNPDSCTVSSGTELVTGNGGQLAGGAAGLTVRFSPRLMAAVNYRYLGTVSGDDLFRQSWAAVPDHRVCGRVTYEPADGFSIWARIWYYSSAYWKAYEELEGTRCVIEGVETPYSPQVDAFTSVDVTLRKLFWSRKLAADLAVRNLFDDRISYHPIGASFGLSFFFQLSFALPAL
jgi:hypothetical protein